MTAPYIILSSFVALANLDAGIKLYNGCDSVYSVLGDKKATVTGSPTFGSDGLTLINTGKSMTLDAGDMLSYGNDSDFNFGKASKWAVEFMVTPISPGTIISKVDGSDVGWSVGIDSDNRIIAKAYVSGADYKQNKSEDILSDGTSYHILVQFSFGMATPFKRPCPYITITIDGKEQIPYTQYNALSYAPNLIGDFTNTGSFVIGSAEFAGLLDEIAVYSGSLGNAKNIQQRTWMAKYSSVVPTWIKPSTVNLILDQDIDSDADDAGDIHTAIALKRLGEINLLGDIVSTASPYAAPAAKAIAEWWEDDVLIAQYQGAEGRKYAHDVALWASQCREDFRPTDDRTNYPDDIVTYRTLLASAANNSVVIVTTGYLISLQGLMNSAGDGISPLTGMELLTSKVHSIFIVDNYYPSGLDSEVNSIAYNGSGHPASWKDVIENCPCDIIFAGAEFGFQVIKGAPIKDPDDYATNPFRYAYHYNPLISNVRPCWGVLPVLVAARGLGNDFILSYPFTQEINGVTGLAENLTYTALGNRWYLRFATGFDNVTKVGNDIQTIFNLNKDLV